MKDDQERKLFLDLVIAAISALETGRKVSSFAKALSRVLMQKGVVTAKEIEKVELGYARIGLVSDDPDHVRSIEQWNSLVERLEEARRRLSEEGSR
jgi:hypothetical protein